jgi:hypothetical protein
MNISNNPPDMTIMAQDVMKDLNEWLSENPVIQTEENAREAKLFLDRGKLAIKDLEDEREGKVRPLNEQVKGINQYYRGPRETLSRVIEELQSRLGAFIRAEEERRIHAAEAAHQRAEEAERAARDAERLEQDAKEEAAAGVVGVNVGDSIKAADDAFKEYERLTRASALAEKESHVKIGGGLSRAIGLRNKEILEIVDIIEALDDLGLTSDIREAVLKSARAYRKLHDKLPKGISVYVETKL